MSDLPVCSSDTVSCYPLNTNTQDHESCNTYIAHNVNRTVNATIGAFSLPVFSVKRNFLIQGNWSINFNGATAIYGYGNATDANNPFGVVTCNQTSSIQASCNFSEQCTMMNVVFHHINLQYNVMFFERTTDTLNVQTSSSNLAQFRTRWGTFYTHRIIIPSGSQVTRLKEFIYMKNGVQTVLSSVNSTYNPFPKTASVIATGGLGATDISLGDATAAQNVDTSGAMLLLCVPQPPGESTPVDPMVMKMGFYDYTAVGDNLGQADGGKDFFYPEWIRNMQPDPYWASEASIRWGYTNQGASLPVTGQVMPQLQWQIAPQCSYAVHPTEGEMWAWVFSNGSQDYSLCQLNGVDVTTALSTAVKPFPLQQFNAYTPISLI